MCGSVEQWIDQSEDMHLKYQPTDPWLTLAKIILALHAFWHHVKIFCKISAAAEVKLKGGRWTKESEVLIPWEN